jgi:hypothetical protein
MQFDRVIAASMAADHGEYDSLAYFSAITGFSADMMRMGTLPYLAMACPPEAVISAGEAKAAPDMQNERRRIRPPRSRPATRPAVLDAATRARDWREAPQCLREQPRL